MTDAGLIRYFTLHNMPAAAAIPYVVAAASAYGSISQANSAKKAADAAGRAGQVDIDALDAKTREIALRNAQESKALEDAMTPEVGQLRTRANQGVLSSLDDNSMAGAESLLKGSIGKDVAGRVRTPLLEAAIAKARENLGLGGKLDIDTQNAVTRRGLATAASVGGGGLGLGRDVVARDLGLTSLQLQQQRLNDASKIGAQEFGVEQENNNTLFNNSANVLNQIQLLRAIQDGKFGRNLAAAQYGQSIAPPVVGLDPASAGNIMVGNANNAQAALANKANISGQQSSNYANLAGNALGYGLLQYNKSNPYQPPVATSSNSSAVRYGV